MTAHPDRLHTRIAELEAQLTEQEAVSAAKDAFIAALGRELSNPLAPVLLAVERVRAVAPSADAGRLEAALVLLERAICAFDRRTRVLLNLADMTAGAPAPPPGPVEVARVLRAAMDRQAEVSRRAGCILSVDAMPGLRALANEESLGQLLEYLLVNAFRFGAGRPVILRARSADDGRVLISVIDRGPGMDAEEAANAFRLFDRPRDDREPGLGVGLWVASQLAGTMGGRLWVESELGKGAQFHVSLASADVSPVAPQTETLQVRGVPAER